MQHMTKEQIEALSKGALLAIVSSTKREGIFAAEYAWAEATLSIKHRVVDMTPSWTGIMPLLIAVISDGTEKGRDAARVELMNLAATMDRMIEEQKEG